MSNVIPFPNREPPVAPLNEEERVDPSSMRNHFATALEQAMCSLKEVAIVFQIDTGIDTANIRAKLDELRDEVVTFSLVDQAQMSRS